MDSVVHFLNNLSQNPIRSLRSFATWHPPPSRIQIPSFCVLSPSKLLKNSITIHPFVSLSCLCDLYSPSDLIHDNIRIIMHCRISRTAASRVKNNILPIFFAFFFFFYSGHFCVRIRKYWPSFILIKLCLQARSPFYLKLIN